jgi:type II secretory ATPase GspE/PulE/Tfp pilus assembly ATPase PilB-like protein
MSKQATVKIRKTEKSRKKATADLRDRFIAGSNELFDVLLSYAVELEARELHFEWREEGLKLRWRLGGKLAEPFKFDSAQSAGLRDQICRLFKLEPSGKLSFQERTIKHVFGKQAYFLSLSAVPVVDGERFFLHIERSDKYDLSRLGLNKVQLQAVGDLLTAEGGIVIAGAVKGPARQLQLKALAGHFRGQKERAVLVSEQPVYDWQDGDIMAVKPEIGFTRLVALRSAMQGDYDLVLLDMVTRTEEMELVLDLARLGKKIIIGLPWSSPSKNFHYLWQLTAEKAAFRGFAKGMIVEQSLPGVCRHCRKSQKLSAQGREAISRSFAGMPEAIVNKLKLNRLSGQEYYQAGGCFFCNKTGQSGLEHVRSVMKFKKPAKEQAANFNFNDLISKQSFISLRQIAIMRAGEGRINLLDALSFIY